MPVIIQAKDGQMKMVGRQPLTRSALSSRGRDAVSLKCVHLANRVNVDTWPGVKVERYATCRRVPKGWNMKKEAVKDCQRQRCQLRLMLQSSRGGVRPPLFGALHYAVVLPLTHKVSLTKRQQPSPLKAFPAKRPNKKKGFAPPTGPTGG